MSKTACRTVLLALTLFLLLPVASSAQTKKVPAPHNSNSPESPKASKTPSKLPLQSITMANTAEAVRKVAEEAAARAQTAKSAARTPDKTGSQQEADGAILEFRPVNSSPLSDSAADALQGKSQKKSVLKNVHGSVYGTTVSQAGRANAEGGAVGAGSGNGKFNIFVEGEHAHSGTPAPQ